MNDELNNATELEPSGEQRRLYRHRKRTEWGLALLVWEHDGKRGYQFEDGELRVFKRGFYDLLEPVESEVSDKADLVADLKREIGRGEVKKELEAKGQTLLTFNEQLTIFRFQYPKGFQDPAWLEGFRGEGAAKQLKKHRQPAIERAQAKLAQDVIDQQISQSAFDDVWEGAISLLDSTSLVTSNQLKPLQGLEGAGREVYVRNLRELLYGTAHYNPRFDAYVHSIRGAGWELGTALQSVVHADTQVCVKPSTFRAQAQWMAPGMKHARKPDSRSYDRYLTMSQAVRSKLEEAHLKPHDLLDIHDFIWITLRPAAKKLLDQARPVPADGEVTGEES